MGGNYRGAAEVLNRWHERNCKDHAAHSAVKNHVGKFMKTKRIKTEKVQSGSSNPYSPWCQASFRWAKHLTIQYGKIDPYCVMDPPMPAPPPGTKQQ